MKLNKYEIEINKIKENPNNIKNIILRRIGQHKLYKYLSNIPDYSIKTLKAEYIYASKISEFNDPFEINFAVSERIMLNEIMSYFIDKTYIEGKINQKLIKRIFTEKRSSDLNELKNQSECFLKDIMIAITSNHQIYNQIMSNSKDRFYKNKNKNFIEKATKEIFKDYSFKSNIYSKMFKEEFRQFDIAANLEKLFLNEDYSVEDFTGNIKFIESQGTFDNYFFKSNKLDFYDAIVKYDKKVNSSSIFFENITKTYSEIKQNKIKNINDMENIFGITCLSTERDNGLMWSHYANKHQGIVIEYDFSKLSDKDFEKLAFTFHVEYSDKRINLSDFNFDYYDKENIINDTSILEYIKLIFRKSIQWQYEKEIRIVSLISESGSREIPLKCISAVYLGACSGDEFINEIKSLCVNKNIKLYKYELDKEEYKLEEHLIY